MSMSIVPGTIRRIHMLGEGNHDISTDPTVRRPILQAIDVMAVKNVTDRYRIILSDGEFYIQGMLATQLNGLVTNGELQNNAIVEVVDYMNNRVKDKMVLIVLNLNVLSIHPKRIGAPQDLEKVTPVAITQPQSLYQPLNNTTNVDTVTSDMSYRSKNAVASPLSSRNNPYGSVPMTTGSAAHQPMHRPGSTHSSIGATAPIVRDTTSTHITPISGLNMYNNRWTIKARVTSKSDVRTWSNAKGEGSLFSIELLDSSGVDIRATFFKEAVERFHSMLQVGKVYRFSGGRLKVASQQWNTCKSSMEITFDQNSEIHLDNDSGDIQKLNYDFRKIVEIEHMEANKYVDVLAICKTVAEPVTLTSKKTGQELIKCDVTLADDSGVEINMTLWGDKAKSAPMEFRGTPLVACRRARVSDFGGKSLSAGDSVIANPSDVPQAPLLLQWWRTLGSAGSVPSRSLSSSAGGLLGKIESLTERKSIAAIKEENMGIGDQADWLSFKATITFLKSDKDGGAWYTACPNPADPCKNLFKVTQTTDGNWFCDKCQTSYPNCVRRWIFSGVVEDDTSSSWVSFFNEQAVTLLGGATADDVFSRAYTDGGFDQNAYDSVFAKSKYTEWLFKCKVKKELYNDETRAKTSVFSLAPVDYVKESRDMLAEIAKF